MGSAEIRALLNVAYVGLGKPPKPPVVGPPDRDLDKIPDSEDACPDEAGPPSKNPKLNGCPAHDRDGDGIDDDDDFCPDRAGIPYPDPKANGCPDSDNDGLPDPVDQCVNEPGPAPSGCPKYAHLALGAFKVDPPIDFGVGGGEKLPAQAAPRSRRWPPPCAPTPPSGRRRLPSAPRAPSRRCPRSARRRSCSSSAPGTSTRAATRSRSRTISGRASST